MPHLHVPEGSPLGLAAVVAEGRRGRKPSATLQRARTAPRLSATGGMEDKSVTHVKMLYAQPILGIIVRQTK